MPYGSMIVASEAQGPPSRPLPDRTESIGAHPDELQTWCVHTLYPWPPAGFGNLLSRKAWAEAAARWALSRAIRAFTRDVAGWYSHVVMRRGGEGWEATERGVVPFFPTDYLRRNLRVDVYWIRSTITNAGARPQEDGAVRELRRLLGTGYDFGQIFKLALDELTALEFQIDATTKRIICSELQAMAYAAPDCHMDLPAMLGARLWQWTPDHTALLWDRYEGQAIVYRGRLVA